MKVVLRAEDDTLRPQKDENDRNYLSDSYDGPGVFISVKLSSARIYIFDSIIDSINFKMGVSSIHGAMRMSRSLWI